MALLSAAILLVCLPALIPAEGGDKEEFHSWCIQHKRVYRSEAEEGKAFGAYLSNRALVQELNQANRESTFALNKFADMTQDEFKAKILMRPVTPIGNDSSRPIFNHPRPYRALPTSFDWRDKGVVSPVKDQGSAGSCWAFSTVGNIEGQWAMKTGNVTSLSAELLVDCDDSKDPQHDRADCGVFGGWPYLAYDFIKRLGGIESSADYPYCSGQGLCYPCPPSGYNTTLCGPPPLYCNKTQSCSAKLNPAMFVPGLKVKSWVMFDKNETSMAYNLMQQGPLSVLIDAEFLQFYHSGVWNPPGCGGADLDHAVLLVGFGVDKGLFREKPYWLIKNSWGTDWGMEGYFKMARGKAKCGINQEVTSAILE